MRYREILLVVLVCIVLVSLMDAITNSLDIEKFSWDFQFYISLSERGFDARPMLSPFAYRYPTPFIAAGLCSIFGVPTESGFRMVAYMGAILQLCGVFLLVRCFIKSKGGAYLAMFVTALSFFNIKFLVFDVYRPDHFAYAFLLLGFYLFVKRRYYLLLITTAAGVQFREFVLVPMLAYLVTLAASKEWRPLRRYALPSLICIIVAVVLPRLLIPITHSWQFIEFSPAGILRILKVPFFLRRDLNLVYSIIAYGLPTLMLLSVPRLRLVLVRD